HAAPRPRSHTPHFFILLPRPPPRPTLFPYTTLFRSPPAPRLGGDPARSDRRGRAAREGLGHRRRRLERHFVHRAAPRRHAGRSRDRKSTRLNSSHVKISYAVFCLKKKKKQIETHDAW